MCKCFKLTDKQYNDMIQYDLLIWYFNDLTKENEYLEENRKNVKNNLFGKKLINIKIDTNRCIKNQIFKDIKMSNFDLPLF